MLYKSSVLTPSLIFTLSKGKYNHSNEHLHLLTLDMKSFIAVDSDGLILIFKKSLL